MKSKNIYLIFSLISLALASALAQQPTHAKYNFSNSEKVDSITLTGKILNRMTTLEVPLTTVEILRADSSIISTVTGGWKGEIWTKEGLAIDSSSYYSINMPKVNGNYIIRVSKQGFETKYVPYTLSNLHKRDNNREAPNIYLSPEKVRTLEEFTVKTSKIKFYHKGDTLVYNADAFMLPEGSMLDALITQLPGVQIKDNGKIYVNGRFVESLLLNGKDFFKGDKNVILENIGVYAVKNIAVYEKQDEMAEVLGDRGDIEKEFVMDVRLKKEYRIGTMINAEAGGGTASRYIGRLFVMRYTDNSRISLYGNANNINRMNRLTSAKQQFERNSKDGITSKANGGIDYFADNQRKTWEVSGNADANYTDRKNVVITNALNYLQDADNFEFSTIHNRAKDFSFSTEHNFKLKQKKWNLGLKPSFSYNKNRTNDETVAATFNQEIQDLNEDIVKSIYSGDYRNIQSALINRNLKAYDADSHGYEAQLQGSSRVKIPNSPDAVELKFTAQYKRNSLFGNTLQDICYGSAPESSLLQQRFSSNRPQYNFKIQALGRYYFNIPFGSLNASYEFIHTQNRKNSDIALLEAMAQNDMAQFDPGEIPVPDFENSYTSKLYKNQHTLKLTWSYKRKIDKTEMKINFDPKFFIERHDLFYQQANTLATPHKTFTRFNIENLGLQFRDLRENWSARLNYKLQQTTPNMINMVAVENTTDPLNIRLGNPELRNKTAHNLEILYFHTLSRKVSHDIMFDFNAAVNDFISGYRYDSETGARYFKTYNVSGNWGGHLDYNIDYMFGYQQRFTLSNFISGGYFRFADMVGYDQDPVKQKVNRKNISESISLNYADEKFNLTIEGSIDYYASDSNNRLLLKNNYGTADGMFKGSVKLPLNFQLRTDFDIIKRFGYIEDSMNDINYLWNAGLDYLIQKGTWRISLEAKDILNQNKGINYYVNANGRTQTLSTVLPRYMMLSVSYRFDFKPKKK